MPIDLRPISDLQVLKILNTTEGHFADLKSKDIQPAKLTKTMAAFANADGGELYVGVDEIKTEGRRLWRGFASAEEANGHIQALESLFPLGSDFEYTFLAARDNPGVVLQVVVHKTTQIKAASGGRVYVRRGAQNLPLITEEELSRLRFNKGIASFENELVQAELDLIMNSVTVIKFMLEIVPTADPSQWLRKQRLILNDKPTVAGLILFCDEPQAVLPKRCGIKIYRYKTKDAAGTRDTLAFDPITIDGSAYDQIHDAVQRTVEVIEGISTLGAVGLETTAYPHEALHEIITNAVLHRDYSIADDVHVRIFDNRVEVQSPGTLPAHITVENILDERFARNGSLVRLINKFPNAPNKDVGEGLNTAFDAMRRRGGCGKDIWWKSPRCKDGLSHQTWKSRIVRGIPTFPQPRRLLVIYTKLKTRTRRCCSPNGT
ncbi:ATP-binding protein [Tunturibacter psychrotolerans]|uniref:ATP-binding protein n=1 Tax=Tunturiibacter psychrotolerans TaxID=3069686 RepID=A0AAU7ZKA3_9BACT